MHIISRKPLREFARKHSDSETSLNVWFRVIQRNTFSSFEELRNAFPTADRVGDKIVFNISGNKYRLIAAIHFNRQKVYVLHILTHAAYDRGRWK